MDRKNTPRKTDRRASTRRLSLLPWTFHECHRKNPWCLTQHDPAMDTPLWYPTRTTPRTKDGCCRA